MEERAKTRVPFHVRASVQYNGKTIDGDVKDLSMNGLFISTGDELPVNSTTKIVVYLSGSSSELTLNLEGTVIRKDDSGIAFNFTEMDLDSYIHLRNIMAFNKTDNNKIVQEFEDARINTDIKD